MKIHKTTTSPRSLDSSYENRYSCRRSTPSLYKILSAATVALAVVYRAIPSQADTCTPSLYSEWGYPTFDINCPTKSWLNATTTHAEELQQLEEDQFTIDGHKLFFWSDDPSYRPIYVPLNGALKTPSSRSFFNKTDKDAKFGLSYDELNDYPSLKGLVSDYEKALPQWHQGTGVRISEIYFERKVATTIYGGRPLSFHTDAQGDDKYLSISTIPLTERAPTQRLKEWLTHDGARVIVSEDQSGISPTDVRVIDYDSKEEKILPVDSLHKPICVPDAQTRVVPGFYLKDVKHESYLSPKPKNRDWNAEEILKSSSVYTSHGTILTGRHVHSGPDSNEIRRIQRTMSHNIPNRDEICNFREKVHYRLLLGILYELVTPVEDAIEITSGQIDFNW